MYSAAIGTIHVSRASSTAIGGRHTDKAGCFLCQVLAFRPRKQREVPHHPRAGQRVPAEADSILVLNLTPLVLERIVVHVGWWLWASCLAYEVRGGTEAAPTIGFGGGRRRPGGIWRCGEGEEGGAINRSAAPRIGSRLQQKRTCYVPNIELVGWGDGEPMRPDWSYGGLATNRASAIQAPPT